MCERCGSGANFLKSQCATPRYRRRHAEITPRCRARNVWPGLAHGVRYKWSHADTQPPRTSGDVCTASRGRLGDLDGTAIWGVDLQDGEFRLMVGSGSDAGVRSHAHINPLACGCMSTRRCAHCVHFLMCLLQEIQRCLTNCPKRCNGSPRNRLDLQDEGVTEGEGEGSS